MNTLFMESYNHLPKRQKVEGKELILKSVDIGKEYEGVYKSETIYKEIEIISTDRYGIDITLELIKKEGSISINLHKKRSKMIQVIITKGKESYIYNRKDHNFTIFEQSIIGEFDKTIQKYIYNGMCKKWNCLQKECEKMMGLHKKNIMEVYIYIETYKKMLKYNKSDI